MVQEIDNPTSVGQSPPSDEFQKINATLKGGETGTIIDSNYGDKLGFFMGSARGILNEHSGRLFVLVSLIGFVLVFYSGNLEDWKDFWRFIAFLPFVVFFYWLVRVIELRTKSKK